LKLVATVATMLEGANPHDILVDDVLKESGISRGSLYHHFGDFDGLIHATLLSRFATNVEADGAAMWHLADSATSQEDYWNRIRQLSAATQVPSRAPIRAERARLIGMASVSSEFAGKLAAVQDRLTEVMAEAIEHGQSKGWVNPALSPRALSLFLQAYSLGRAIDDISGTHVPNQEWVDLIDTVLASFEA
jgi:AcrR family transcriptional regulator